MIQSREKCEKPIFWANLGQKWALGDRKNFLQNFNCVTVFLLQKHSFMQKIKKNLMIQSREKCEKPIFWANLGPGGPRKIFFKNRAPSYSRYYGCKKSEKSNDPILRKQDITVSNKMCL